MTKKTETYRQHHTEVRQLAGRIATLLTSPSITNNLEEVSTTVRDLCSKFYVHLAVEDQALYPRMINHGNPQLKQVAEQFQKEMGGLKDRLNLYRKRWPGLTAIINDNQGFIAETRDILTALERRIAREDTELYDLFDRI
jgi:hemerythrin-like domain-containing protein